MIISIIIPLYRSLEFFRPVLNSINEQTYKDIEIIIVNDCSPNFTDEELSDFLSQYSNLKIQQYKTEKNSGPGVARNVGLQYVTGDYILFLDDDDPFIESYTLSTIVNKINDNYDYAYIGTSIIYYYNLEYEGEAIAERNNYFNGYFYNTRYIKQFNITFDPHFSYLHENVLFHQMYQFYACTLNHYPILNLDYLYSINKCTFDDSNNLSNNANHLSSLLDLISIDFQIFELKYRHSIIDYNLLYDYYKNLYNILLCLIYHIQLEAPDLNKLQWCLHSLESFDNYIQKHITDLRQLEKMGKPSNKFQNRLEEYGLKINEGKFEDFHDTYPTLKEKIINAVYKPIYT